jgi:hypothetical protein
MEFFLIIKHEAKEWSRGRIWWLRLPLLLFFVYILFHHLKDPEYKSIIGPLNLGIHELGHVIFGLFGMFIGILGGSLLQCLAPVLAVFNFYRQKDFFAIALCSGWLSTNIFEVATYVADARSMKLPLVGFTPDPIHDWNYLLRKLNLLQHDQHIAALLRISAVIFMLTCFISGAWILWQMYISKNDPSNDQFTVRW